MLGTLKLVLSDPSTTLPGIDYAKSNYSMQGYYQCVIHAAGYIPQTSGKVNIQFGGKFKYAFIAISFGIYNSIFY